MTKNLSIQSSAFPDGSRVRYLFGMKQPVVRCMRGIMKNAIINEVRKGGVCYSDLPLVQQARKLASK